MIDVIFTIDGVEQTQTAIFYNLKDMQGFIKTFKEEVLANYSNATNIRLGEAWIGIGAEK